MIAVARTDRVFGISPSDLLIVIPALGLAAGAILWFHYHGIALCPFNRITGLPCPLCGGTRSVVALFCGEPVQALEYNPLVCIGALLLPVYGICRLAGMRRVGAIRRVPSVIWATLLAVAVIANWVYLICVGR